MYSSRSTEDIHQIVVKFADEGRDCVLAVVLDADGSTPCRVGSKAVIDAEGVIQGTIGGGWVEAETQRRAAETLKAGRPVVLEFNLDSPAVGDDHPICGGTVRVLMDPTAVRHREVYATAFAIRRDRQRGVLLTTIRGRNEWDVAVEFLDKQAISPGLGFPGTEAIGSALEREEPSLFVSEATPEGQRLEVLVEPVAYIGMIGSGRKVAMMRKDFVESGRATAAEFDRVYAPIGLEIGSVTVPELAASIVAQLVAVRRTGTSPQIATRQHLRL
ncbi:MAG: XdhC family protein [Planctomycetes bacterium]|nr:XdhC family protein [Planctomycetota bacterium]